MKLFKFLLSSLTILAVATGCDENNIGSSITDVNTHLIVDSTFTITGESLANPEVRSRTVTQLIGKIQATEYGSLQSDIVTEFMPTAVLDTTGVSVNDIDSVKLHFLSPMGHYTGDSITPMQVSVYKLNKKLPYPIYSNFNPEGYYSKDDLIGRETYAMTMLGQKDTLYTYDNNFNQVFYRAIDITLPLQFGKDLFNKYLTNPEIFSDPELFTQYFPGIYATTTYGNGRVTHIASTQIDLYYKKHTKTEQDKDTVIRKVGQYFGVSPEVVTNNNIRLVPSESLKESVKNGDIIIQAPTGYEARIKFPTRKVVDKYKELSLKGLTVLNNVEFNIPATEIKNDKKIKVPQYLLLIRESEKEEFFEKNKTADNINSFYAEYDKKTKSYKFIMREFIKELITKEVEVADKDENLLLIPVDVHVESAQGQQNFVVAITPQLSAPAMVKINAEDAKIIATFSKKDFQ